MRKRIIISLILLILLTTITFQQQLVISKFNLKKINIENNFLLKESDLKNLLIPIYNKNLIFLNNEEIEKALLQNNFIDSFNIKKKYPDTLKIKIYEKKPIAILINKKNKFYLSEKIDLIKFENIKIYQNLPYVFGNKDEFKIFYKNLNTINFPIARIKKYILFESKRWDLETSNKKIIKLPPENYIISLENYLTLSNKKNFNRYKVFDYRINNQLILK
tara:strand:+ start:411 stop:1067 length:657 start_codon:yes stop_codon:yes gene_type:complete